MEYSEPICVPYRGIGGPAADEITVGVDGRPFSFAYQSNTLGSTALGLLKTRGNQMAGTTAI